MRGPDFDSSPKPCVAPRGTADDALALESSGGPLSQNQQEDLSRSIDYLEARKDIDVQKLGYFGYSWGGEMGGIIPAVEPRLKVAVLHVAGLGFDRPLPEVDPLNFVPHVSIPVLMLNGKLDPYFPVETS